MYNCYIKGNKYSKGDIKSLFTRYENLRQMTSLGYSYRKWNRRVESCRQGFEDNYSIAY